MNTLLSRFSIVMCGPRVPGNIGGAARALKAMGLSRLSLVTPLHFPHEAATARASGATDVLDAAGVFPDLASALADATWVIGFSARERREGPPVVDATAALREALAHAPSGRVALVFGHERNGLSNAEAACCQRLAHIDTGPELGSLNLAAAVQIACYELRRLARGTAEAPAPSGPVLADRAALDALMRRLWQGLESRGALPRSAPKHQLVERRVAQVLARAQPTDAEVKALHGLLGWLGLGD